MYLLFFIYSVFLYLGSILRLRSILGLSLKTALLSCIADSIPANAPWFSIPCSEGDWQAYLEALVSG